MAPGPGDATFGDVPVVRVPALELPRYRAFRVGIPFASAEQAVVGFQPDVVHLASPAVLGWAGLRAAARLDVPVVAAYQTDLMGFARQYGLRTQALVGRWLARLHRRAHRTLVPSTASWAQLTELGIPDLHLWGRGVDLSLFAPARRDESLHEAWAGGGSTKTVVGYVGRLAAEKQVRRLSTLAGLPGIQLVIVGDGPERPWLQQHLPGAVFTGMLHGDQLARAFASLDVFVHTGEAETFCQTIQEAQASGVVVVAPASGGPLDLVEHGRTGLLYQPGSSTSFADRLLDLMGDVALRGRVAAEAQIGVSGRTWSTVVDQLADVHYSQVLRGDSGAGVPSAA